MCGAQLYGMVEFYEMRRSHRLIKAAEVADA